MSFLLFFGLWFLFVEQISVAEAVAATVASAIASTLLVALARFGLLELQFHRFRLASTWEIPGRALRDAVIVLGALARHPAGGQALRGAIVAIPLDHDSAIGPEGPDLFRTWATSLGSNSVVVGERDRTVLVHQLVPADPGQLAGEVREL